MNKNQCTKEKSCVFYVSNYHFEMISLPYISKKLEENKKILILTEENLEETINTLISKMNFKEQKKNKILEINWKNNNEDKIKELKEEINNKKEIEIFIKGNEEYIKNTNKNIEKIIKNNKNVKIIDCYNIEEIQSKINNIKNYYEKVISTIGEKNI